MRILGMFARQPVPGRVKTRLAGVWGSDRAAALYQCFVCDQVERYARCGDRRVLAFTESSVSPSSVSTREQSASPAHSSGDDRPVVSGAEAEARAWFARHTGSAWELWQQPPLGLGDRIAAFFQTQADLHDQQRSQTGGLPGLRSGDNVDGIDSRILLIGSDSPTIPVEYLEDAWQKLTRVDAVVGPAADGGYWLVGLRGSVTQRCDSLFDGVEWSTSEVLTQQVARLRDCGLTLDLLPVWYDVDSLDAVNMLHGHLDAMETAGMDHSLPRTADFLRNKGLRPDGV